MHFPDLKITYSHQIAEGDMIAGRFTLTGTHQGDFGGIAATGKQISVTGSRSSFVLWKVKSLNIGLKWIRLE